MRCGNRPHPVPAATAVWGSAPPPSACAARCLAGGRRLRLGATAAGVHCRGAPPSSRTAADAYGRHRRRRLDPPPPRDAGRRSLPAGGEPLRGGVPRVGQRRKPMACAAAPPPWRNADRRWWRCGASLKWWCRSSSSTTRTFIARHPGSPAMVEADQIGHGILQDDGHGVYKRSGHPCCGSRGRGCVQSSSGVLQWIGRTRKSSSVQEIVST